MKSDHELLEAAAKAAGLPIEFDEGTCNGWWPNGRTSTGDVDEWWNPLTDDGDALRLAVKLGLCVDTGAMCHWGMVTFISGQYWRRSGLTGFGEETHGDDPLGATRRAIVRAAAAMAG